MALPRPKPQKKTNVANPKDSNAKAERAVKEQHRGHFSGEGKSASDGTHKKYATTGSGSRKKTGFKKA
jgi:hypothetical protein